MYILINKCFGGFHVEAGILTKLGIVDSDGYPDTFGHKRQTRTNLDLIHMVLNGEIKPDEDGTDIRVIKIPDEATDWLITEYDGAETLYYVLKGKIIMANNDELMPNAIRNYNDEEE